MSVGFRCLNSECNCLDLEAYECSCHLFFFFLKSYPGILSYSLFSGPRHLILSSILISSILISSEADYCLNSTDYGLYEQINHKTVSLIPETSKKICICRHTGYIACLPSLSLCLLRPSAKRRKYVSQIQFSLCLGTSHSVICASLANCRHCFYTNSLCFFIFFFCLPSQLLVFHKYLHA